MKKNVILLFIAFLSFTCLGNDGVYLNRGSVIYSTKETKIYLSKEILSFTVRDKIARVDIYF